MDSLIIVCSYHHKNTERIARAMARELDADVLTPREIDPRDLQSYDLVGFGSGIYSGKHHRTILDLADEISQVEDGMAFIFSTCGAPKVAMNDGYVEEVHTELRTRLRSKGFRVLGEFCCPGHNTNSFLRLFGGINRGRPNAEDLKDASDFAARVKLGPVES
jgi:flavodoxin